MKKLFLFPLLLILSSCGPVEEDEPLIIPERGIVSYKDLELGVTCFQSSHPDPGLSCVEELITSPMFPEKEISLLVKTYDPATRTACYQSIFTNQAISCLILKKPLVSN